MYADACICVPCYHNCICNKFMRIVGVNHRCHNCICSKHVCKHGHKVGVKYIRDMSTPTVYSLKQEILNLANAINQSKPIDMSALVTRLDIADKLDVQQQTTIDELKKQVADLQTQINQLQKQIIAINTRLKL